MKRQERFLLSTMLFCILFFNATLDAKVNNGDTESNPVRFTSSFFKKEHFFYTSASHLFANASNIISTTETEEFTSNVIDANAIVSLIQSLKTNDSGKIIKNWSEDIGVIAIVLALPIVIALVLKFKILMKGVYILLPISSLIFIWIIAEANFGVRKVFFDNAFETDVTIFIDDKKIVELPARSFCRIDITYGEHLVKVIENVNGSIVDDLKILVLAKRRGLENILMVFNIGSKNSYFLETTHP